MAMPEVANKSQVIDFEASRENRRRDRFAVNYRYFGPSQEPTPFMTREQLAIKSKQNEIRKKIKEVAVEGGTQYLFQHYAPDYPVAIPYLHGYIEAPSQQCFDSWFSVLAEYDIDIDQERGLELTQDTVFVIKSLPNTEILASPFIPNTEFKTILWGVREKRISPQSVSKIGSETGDSA